MALTLADYKLDVNRALGGDFNEPHANALMPTQIVNEAGRYLYGCRSWNFAIRPRAGLQFTSDTEYVALPTDFGELDAYSYNDTSKILELTTPQDLEDKRATSASTLGRVWATIIQPSQTVTSDVGAVMDVPRLEFYPTSSSTVSDAVYITYHAKWAELSEELDVANIPLWCESLLRAFVRAFAAGWYEDPVASVPPRIEEVRKSTFYTDAVDRDSRIQPDLGRITGGQAEYIYNNPWDGVTSDPS